MDDTFFWQHNPSEVYPFKRAYVIMDAGDQITVDYEPQKKLARIAIKSQVSGENYAIVKNGMVIRERSAETETHVEFEPIVEPYKALINTIPNNYVLGILGGVYGIKQQSTSRHSSQVYISPILKQKRPKTFREWVYYLFVGRPAPPKRPKQKQPLWPRIKVRFWSEFIDLALAAGIGAYIYFYHWDYEFLGATLAFMGMSFGFVDWLYRKRNPLLTKVTTVLASGSYFYLYDFMYR